MPMPIPRRLADLTPRSSLAVLLVLGIVGAACSNGSSTSRVPATDVAGTTTVAAPDTNEPTTLATAEATTGTVADTTTALTSAPAADVTVAPSPFELSSLPALIASAEQAMADPSIAPLGVAREAIGFPFEIPVPQGSTLSQFAGDLSVLDDGHATYHFGYWAVGPDGAVPDIDIALDDNGPGSVQITEIWDPIMADLGFERANSTASDPGDPGGPNSVNHVYVATSPETVVNGVAGEVPTVFIWADEDITQATYAGGEPRGGYRVELEFDTAEGTGMPFPLAVALMDALPRPDGLELSDVGITLRTRAADSFAADRGLTYIELHLEWQAPPDSLAEVVAFYAAPGAVFEEPTTLVPGEIDFFDPTTIAAAELTDYDTASKRLSLVLLQRYEGLLGIDASSDGLEPLTLFFDIAIDSIAPELTLPNG